MSVTPFLPSEYTLTVLEERLSATSSRVQMTCTGRGYLYFEAEEAVYLSLLTKSVMCILESNPHFSEKEREAGGKLIRRLKSYYSELKELQIRRCFLASAFGACCGADDPDVMQSIIRDELENLVTLYTQEQFRQAFPRNPLPATASDIVFGTDLENPTKLYRPPELFR